MTSRELRRDTGGVHQRGEHVVGASHPGGGSRIRQAAPERGEVGGDRAALLRRHGREVAARRLVQMERELVRADPSERRSKAVDRASRVRDGRVASPIRCLELEVQVDLL